MKIGGTRRLLIPADQAYGASPPSGSGIPANAPLVFDVTLHSIGQ
jgi:FKBP-type peptidyl-prolyl cis-trans isomerase FkpA